FPLPSTPPKARAKVLSTAARAQSILSASSTRSSNTWYSRNQTPACCQARSLRQHVMPQPQPISLGRFSPGIPVLRTKRRPVSALRSPKGLRPGKRKRRGLRGGSRGSRRDHNSSETSGLAIGSYLLSPWRESHANNVFLLVPLKRRPFALVVLGGA